MLFQNSKFLVARFVLVLILLSGMIGVMPVQAAHATSSVLQAQTETAIMVKDIYPGSVGSLGNVFKSINGTLYFGASDGVNGSGLWKSDGSTDGTVLVKGGFVNAIQYLESANGLLYFATNDGISGSELWKSDGTAAGTVLVQDVRPGSSGSFPSAITNVNGTVYFRANNGTSGIELWKSDGTASGTVLVKDIIAGSGSPNIDNLTDINGTLFFTANDGSHGNELWKSDGTTTGTVMVKDVYPGLPGTSYYELTNINGVVYFSASNDTTGYELWKSNGTEVGTVLVRDIWGGTNSSFPDSFENVNGTLFFTASNGVNGTELWKSNGTSAGTVMVKDIWPGSSGWGSELTHVGNIVYFGANDGVNARLWKSDGTSAGTVKIGSPAPLDIGNANGVVYYSGSDGVKGYELWRSDGTTAGSTLVKDINPTGDSYPDLFFNADGTLYFRANDGVHGTELWKMGLVDVSTPTATPTSAPTNTPTPAPTYTPTETLSIPSGIVVNTNDSGPGSLRQAIADASPGNTITFDPSLAGQTITLISQINLDKSLAIDGSNLNPSIEISGNLTSRIFYIASNSTVELRSLVLKDGRNDSGGGAIYNDGNLTVINSTFRNNSTTGPGGAIHNNYGLTVNVSNSTFVNNSAQSGGAIYLSQSIFSNDVSSNMVNNTFVGNQANTSSGIGGAIYSNIDNSSMNGNAFFLSNNTFSENGAYSGGNLYNLGSMSFHNNIFANNTSGGDCYSMGSIYPIVVYGLNNLIEDGVSCSQGTFISGDPLLGPLADNGGPTQTMALLPGSPAIDAGTTCVFEDQRGVFRPQGNYCDIGAYEYEFSGTPSVTPSPTYPATLTPTATPTFTSTYTPTNTPTPVPSLFQPYIQFPVGAGEAVAIGDFNSDGRQDVAMTNSMANTSLLFVFLQKSDGTLESPVTYDAGYQPFSLAVGDLNHDGRTDIVATNMPSNEISVFLQMADGSLAPRVTYSTGAAKLAVAVGDLNGDGWDDVAVSGAELGVFTQNGAGTLNPVVTYPATGSPTSVDDIAIADMNNDGRNDIVKKHGSPNFLVYSQNGNGTFGSGVGYSVQNCQSFCTIQGLAAGDVTGDGLNDVVVSFGGNRPTSKVVVFAQGADANLQSQVVYDAYDIPEPIKIADVNQDAQADVLVAHGGWLRLGVFTQKNGGLDPYSLYTIPYSSHYRNSGLAIGDINHDGLPDVAIADYNSGLVVLYHSPSGIPNPPTPTPVPTNTATITPTATSTSTPTNTPTFTPTYTPTDTPTSTPTFTPTPTATPVVLTLVLQPDGIAGLDTYIYNGSKNANYGSNGVMGVGEDNNANNRFARSLLKFDLSSIPANATINSAALSLWTDTDLSSNNRTIRVYRLKVPFNEMQASWNASATGVNWQTPGASGLNDRESIDIGSVLILNNEPLNLEKQIVLTPSKIQEMVNGSFVNRGFIIVADTELNDRFNYKTSDSTSASQRPKLVIQYTLPSGTPAPTSTETSAPTQTNTPLATTTPTPMPTATFTPTAMPTQTNTPTPTSSPTSTPTSTPGSSSSLTFGTTADSYVNVAKPAANYGANSTILVDGSTGPTYEGYLKFNVSGVTGPVQSAVLRVYATSGAVNSVAVYGAGNSWTETGLTWNNKPARTTGALDSRGPITSNNWVEYNVTALIGANGTYTFVLAKDISDSAGFSSKEGAQPPQLIVTFAP